MLKSPLRYPGGKSKALNTIAEHLPDNFSEFREPFVGGGSVFIYLKQKYPDLKIWINDLNCELFLFWKYAQSNLTQLVEEVRHIKRIYTDGRLLFTELTSVDINHFSDFERAVRFFILNRITFSGTVESGGFSQEAFHKRFTESSIERLEKLENILKDDVKITNFDYSHLLTYKGDEAERSRSFDFARHKFAQGKTLGTSSLSNNVFLFLDPPYFAATKSKLYGKDGDLHTFFDHQRFAELMQKCSHRWLITYDDSPQIRENFQACNIHEWELQYGMNNYKQGSAAKGKELLITNYEVKQNWEHKLKNQSLANTSQQLKLDFHPT